MPAFISTPDAAQGFGFKVLWFAVKTFDPALVIDALGLGEATPANWATGLKAAHEHGASPSQDAWAFVSPPIEGWVLAVSARWAYPVAIDANRDIGRRFDLLFSRLMRRFDDVQFFGSHRGAGFVTWARALKGEPQRIFGFADSEVLANLGEQTPEEAKLGFADLSGLSPAEAADRMFDLAESEDAEGAIPDEMQVVELAARWSLDPAGLETLDYPFSAGLAVRIPKDLTQ